MSIPLGVQLFSVRDEIKKDIDKTFAALREIGYEGVEFAMPIQSVPFADLKASLAAADLKVFGWHIGLGDVTGDNFDKSAEFHKSLGNQYLIIASLPAEATATAKACEQSAAQLEQIAQKLNSHGLKLGYHNHYSEFTPLENGKDAFDIIFECAPSLVMQLDTGNARKGGADIYAKLETFTGRGESIHIKPFDGRPGAGGLQTMVGKDDTDYMRILELARQHSTRYFIVEYEEPDYTQIEGVRACFNALKLLGY